MGLGEVRLGLGPSDCVEMEWWTESKEKEVRPLKS